jgi:hypothetical protein
MTLRTWIGIAVAATAWLTAAGWLIFAHRPETVFVPLDSDDINVPANAECNAELVTREGHRGMICREKP